MTVRELRALLEDLPDEMPVAIDAYEGGITIDELQTRVVATRVLGPRSMMGELEEHPAAAGPFYEFADRPEGPTVLLLSRREPA